MPSAPADPDGAWTVSYGAFDDASLDELDVVGALNLSVIPRGYTAVLAPVPGVGWFCDGLFPTATVPTGGGAVDSVNGATGTVVLDAGDVGALDSSSGYNTANGWLKLDGDGTVPDNRIPSTITRDSELTAAISAAIDALLDGVPGALDTLNELAAAINDDASFAASVTTALAGKVPTARTVAGLDLSTDRTAAALKTALAIVTGDVSGLDAALALLAPKTRTVGTGLATTGSVALDMAAVHGTIQTIALTGDPTFSTSNRAAGREVTLIIAAGGSTRTLTWPSWLAVGAALPTSLASGKTLVVSVTFVDTTDAAAIVAAAVQP